MSMSLACRRKNTAFRAIVIGLATAGCSLLSATTAAAATVASPRQATGLAGITGGVKAGISLSQHQGIDDPTLPYTVVSAWRRGNLAAAFLHFPVTDRFGLQQEAVYVQKGSRQTITGDTELQLNDVVPMELDVVYDLDYLEIPVLLRFVWLRGGQRGRRMDLYSLSGFAFAFKLKDRYRLRGFLIGESDEESIPLRADAPMDEVDIFDFAFVYGMGVEWSVKGRRMLLEYRFSLSLERHAFPTYANVVFPDGSEVRPDKDTPPALLRNQAHGFMLGIRF